MHPLPHQYTVDARAGATGSVQLCGDGLPAIMCAPPAQFGGPGDQWSPEDLLIGAVADCFVLSFRAIARASKLEWSHLECRVDGTLDRVEGVTRFVGMTVHARLTAPAGTSRDKAERLLAKAENSCLVSNSLACEIGLETELLTG